MKRVLVTAAAVMVGMAAIVVLLLTMTAGYYIWQLHPWVPAGQTFALGHWHSGNYEFQVWQIKNASTTEPFCDKLFVRQGTNLWQCFDFDIQDSYSPNIKLAEEHDQMVVYRDGENRGVYDLMTHTFRRHGYVQPPAIMAVDPPGEISHN